MAFHRVFPKNSEELELKLMKNFAVKLPQKNISKIAAVLALAVLANIVLLAGSVAGAPGPNQLIQGAVNAAQPAIVAAPGAQTSGTITIYSSLPRTGSSKDQTITLENAMQMALDDFTNGTGKIGNFTINYQKLDDASAALGQWDPAVEKANADKAVADPDAMVYLGTYNSGASKISIPILNAANMVMISPAATYPGLTKAVAGVTEGNEPAVYYPNGPRNFFRVVVTDDLQGPADVSYAVSAANAKRFYVIDDSQSYGKGLADAFSNEVRARGLAVLGRTSINGRESDYRALARQIRDLNPDFIFFGGIAQQQPGKLLADLRAVGITAPFMGGDGLNNPAFVKEAGVAGEGAFSSISGVPVDKLPAKGQDFLKRYQAKYGAPSNYTIYAYEAMTVALTAIQKVNAKDRAAILSAVAATKDFDGVTGKWSFDQNGDTTLSDFAVYQIQDGNLVYRTQTKPRS